MELKVCFAWVVNFKNSKHGLRLTLSLFPWVVKCSIHISTKKDIPINRMGPRPFPPNNPNHGQLGFDPVSKMGDESEGAVNGDIFCLVWVHPGRWTAGTYSHHPFLRKEKMIWTKPPWGIMCKMLIFRAGSIVLSFRRKKSCQLRMLWTKKPNAGALGNGPWREFHCW